MTRELIFPQHKGFSLTLDRPFQRQSFRGVLAGLMALAGVLPFVAVRAAEEYPTRRFEFTGRLDFPPKNRDEYIAFIHKLAPGVEGVRAQYALADVLMREKRYTEAADILRSLTDSTILDNFLRASILTKRAECALKLNLFPEASQLYGAVAQTDVKALGAEALVGMAAADMALGRRDQALMRLKELRAFYPLIIEEPTLWVPLGVIYWQARQYEEAAQFFSRDEKNPAALYFAGLSWRSMKRPGDAAGAFRRLIREHADSVWADRARFELGETFYQQNDLLLARQSFEDILRAPPNRTWELLSDYRMACVETRAKNYGPAEDKLRSLLNRKPDSLLLSNITFLLTDALASQDKIDKIVDLLESDVLRLRTAETTYRLLWARAAVGRYDKALELAKQFLATEFDPDLTPKTILIQGYCNQRLGRQADAMASFQLVVENFPKLPYAADATQLAAINFCQAGQFTPVVTQVNNLWNMVDPLIRRRRPETLFWMAEAYGGLKRGKEARDFYRLFLRDAGMEHALSLSALRGQAVAAAWEKDYDTALSLLRQALQAAQERKDPALIAKYSLDLANFAFNTKSYEDAVGYYRQLEQVAPQHPQMAFALHQEALALYRSQYYNDAVETWEKLLRLYPKDARAPEAQFRTAKTRFDLGQYNEAVAGFEKLIRNYSDAPTVKDARLQIGQAYFNAGDFDRAILAYADYKRLFPKDTRVNELYQTALVRSGKPSDEIMKVIGRDAKSSILADIFWEEGAKLYNDKNYALAREKFQRVLYEFPTSSLAPQASFFRAESLFLEEKFEDAVRAYENFLKAYPEDAQRSLAMFHGAVSLFNAKDYTRAAVAFDKFASEYPDDPTARGARLNVALAYARNQDTEKAVAAFENYAALYPDADDAGSARLQAAQLLEKSGDEERAADAYRRVPVQAGEYPESRYNLAQLANRAKDAAAERAAYESLRSWPAKNDPFRVASLLRLAQMVWEEGDVKTAAALYADVAKNADDEPSKTLARQQIGVLQSAPK
jgi:TolA-binding protein